MLPVKLKFEGLNSYVHEVSIDFTKFYKSRLFGIFGETGGGKSTILDAIILSLYGRTPRLPNIKIKEAINPLKGCIRIEFLFEISGEQYIIRRSISHNNSSVKLYKVSGEKLIPLAEKQTEFQEKIANLIGLSFDEFCKVVILPQNQFAELLKLEPANKAKLMGNLFELDCFGEPLYDRFSERYSQLETTLKEKQSRLNELSKISEENIAAKERQIQEIEKELRKLALTQRERVQRLNMLRNFKQLSEQKEELEKSLKKIEEERIEIERLRQKIQIDDNLAPYKKFFDELKNLNQTLEVNTLKLTKLENELLTTERTVMDKKIEREEFEKQFSTRSEELIGRIKESQQLSELEKEIKELSEKRKQSEKRIKELERNLINLEDDLKKYDSETDVLKKEIELNDAQIKSIQLNAHEMKLYEILPDAVVKIREIKNLMSDIGQLFRKIRKEKAREDEYFERIKKDFKDKLNLTISNFEHVNQKLFSKIAELREQKEIVMQEFETLKTKNMAYILSRSLSEGVPCPVCGSLEHPNPAEAIDMEKFVETEHFIKKLDEEINEIEKFRESIHSLVEKVIETKKGIQTYENEIKEKELKLDEIKKELSQTLPEQHWDNAEKLYRDMMTRRNRVEELMKKINQLNNEFHEKMNRRHETIKKKVEIISEINQLKREIEEIRNLFEDKQLKLFERTAGKTSDEIKRDAEKELERLKSKRAELEREFIKLENNVQKIKLEIAELKQIIGKDRQRQEDITRSLELKAKEMNIELEKLSSMILDDRTKRQIKAQIDDFDQKLNRTKGELERVFKNLMDIPIKTLKKEELEEAEIQLTEVNEKITKLSENLGILREQIRTEKSLILEKDTLGKEISIIETEFGNVGILKNLTYGKEMVKFFSWHLLRQIIILTNEILTTLLGRRFRINVNSNLEFNVLDLYYNKERSVNTLSGGETFVVSFALALALSSYIQSKRKRIMRFFFIDEGFSSLDRELMDSVSMVLNELKSQDRLVGFITHINEIKSLIPHSIEANRDITGSSTLRINF